MRKYAKFILIAAGLILLVYLFAVLGLNIYLQSDGLQRRVRAAAEAAAGSPVQMAGTHYTPWSGFSVTGITVNGDAPAGQPPFLQAAKVSFRFSLLSLLQGKLFISEVVVAGPSLSVFGGRPEPVPGPADQTPQPEVASRPAAGVEITVPAPSPPPAAVEVGRVRIVNGTANVYDSKGALALTLTGVEIAAHVLPNRGVAGTFFVAETSVGAYVHPGDVKGTFVWKGGHLTIPDLHAAWAGGQLTGTVEVNPDGRFTVATSAEGILIKKLAEDAGISGDGSRGSLFAKGNLQGVAGKPETFTGRVDISLQQARFQPLDLIRQIGDLMGIQELQMFELKTAEAWFNIHDKKVSVESLVLESANLVIDAKGPVNFDGKMKLQARLHLNEKLRKDLGALLGGNFKESEREGCQQMPFSISGTVSRPKTDLLDKLTGFHIGEDVGGLIKNLFRSLPQTPKDDSQKKPGGG